MRYVGQVHECTVDIGNYANDAKALEKVKDAFHKRHEELYTYSEPHNAVEVKAQLQGLTAKRISGQVFTAGEYARQARASLADISSRARLPLIVGGTGFYLRALLDGLFPGPARDSALRGAVDFSGAALSWARSPELRARLLAAVRATTVPVLFIHPANDYGLESGPALSAEMTRLGKTNRLKMYPAYGTTTREGHNFLFLDSSVWERDVFAFLDEYVRD